MDYRNLSSVGSVTKSHDIGLDCVVIRDVYHLLSKSDAQVQSGVNDILSFNYTLNYGIGTLSF
jgi:hypothetical protein